MRWAFKEFVAELRADTSRRVLFVEGLKDQIVWRLLMPAAMRGDATIYTAAAIDVPGNLDGECGRLIALAEAISKTDLRERVLFFVDADCDRNLGISSPNGVIFTDGRDFESYLLLTGALHQVCTVAFAKSDNCHSELRSVIGALVRPIGLLRNMAKRNDLKLPFQKTFASGRKRYWRLRNGKHELDIKRLIQAVLQNSEMSLRELDRVTSLYQQERTLSRANGDEQIVHGHDLEALIAWYFGHEIDSIEKIILMSFAICADEIRRLPNISEAISWAKSDL